MSIIALIVIQLLSLVTNQHLAISYEVPAPFEWYRYEGESDSGSCASVNCGPAVVAMAVQFAKNNQIISIKDIRSFISGTNCRFTNNTDLEKALDNWWVNHTTITGMDAVRSAITDRGHIVIVPIIMSKIPAGSDNESTQLSDPSDHFNRYNSYIDGHYVVVKGISQDGNWVIVQDPNVWDGNNKYWYSDNTAKGRGRYYDYQSFAIGFANNGNSAIEISDIAVCQYTAGQGFSSSQLFQDSYNRNGGSSTFGCPTNNVHRWGNGYIQDFSGGRGNESAIMQPDGVNYAYALYGAIWQKYKSPSLNGAVGILGYPISDEGSGYASKITGAQSRYNNFQGGAIEHHSTGPRVGLTIWMGLGIFQKWQSWTSNQYANSTLGLPISDERDAVQSSYRTIGKVVDFEGGHIHWHGNGSRYNQAFETHGSIDDLYTSIAGTASSLGFPISDEYIATTGYPRSDFEGGYITTPDGVNYCPPRGLGEKPSPSGEDFSMLAVWRTTGNRATRFTT